MAVGPVNYTTQCHTSAALAKRKSNQRVVNNIVWCHGCSNHMSNVRRLDRTCFTICRSLTIWIWTHCNSVYFGSSFRKSFSICVFLHRVFDLFGWKFTVFWIVRIHECWSSSFVRWFCVSEVNNCIEIFEISVLNSILDNKKKDTLLVHSICAFGYKRLCSVDFGFFNFWMNTTLRDVSGVNF